MIRRIPEFGWSPLMKNSGEITPLILSLANEQELVSGLIAEGIVRALHADYPDVVCITSLDEIREHATQGPVVVVPTSVRNLDLAARSGAVPLHNTAIVGWSRRLGMAHWDQWDVETCLQQKGFAISSDFQVDNGLDKTHVQRCINAHHRHLSVGVVEHETIRCLPIVEVLNDSIGYQTMYFPDRQYAAAQLDTQTGLVAAEIASVLHQQFCVDFSRTELILEPSGKLVVSAFMPCPLLSSGSSLAWAAKLEGASFEDLCWELVHIAAGRRLGVVDVHSDALHPGNTLSNFYPHSFQLDGVNCGSAEGLLQSLKYQDVTQQAEVARLVGSVAKHAGARQNEEWMRSGLLWWRGEPMERNSERYQIFQQSIYESLFAQSTSFRDALTATRGRVITHRVGSKDPGQTVLTEREFVRSLVRLRSKSLDGSST